MKALVTGGAGYIGSHTVRALCDAGHDVVVVDDLSTGHRDAVDPRARFIDAHMGNYERMSGVLLMVQPNVVLHFAGRIQVGESVQNPLEYWYTNVASSLALFDAVVCSDQAISVVFSSSAAVYGSPAIERGRFPKLTEDHPTMPVNPYGDAKLAVERALRAYGHAYDLPWIALRYFNAAGANVEAGLRERHEPETHLIPLLLDVAAGKRDVFTLHGTDLPTHDGTCVRDFVHVVDLAEAHVLAADKLVKEGVTASGALNLGTGDGHSVLEVIDVVTAVTERAISVTHGPRRDGDPPVLVADPSRAERALNWRAKRGLSQIIRNAWLARNIVT